MESFLKSLAPQTPEVLKKKEFSVARFGAGALAEAAYAVRDTTHFTFRLRKLPSTPGPKAKAIILQKNG